MARRYTRPKVELCSRKDGSKFWETRFWKYELQPNGTERRSHPRLIVGSFEKFPTKRLAEREAQRLYDEAARSYMPVQQASTETSVSVPVPNPKSVVLFEVITEKWMTEVLPNKGDGKFSTRDTAMRHLSKWLLPRFGKTPVGDIQPEDVQLFFNWMKIQKNRQGKPISSKLLRNVKNTLAGVMATAKAWGYISHDPFAGLVLPKYKPPRKQSYTVEHVAEIIARVPARYQIPFYFLAECGLRSGETALDVSDVDLQGQSVCIKRAIWRGHIDSPKTGSSMRRLYISTALTAMLADQIGERIAGPVFPSRNGTPLDMQNFRNRILKPTLKRIGLEFGDIHTLRHFNATLMDSANIPAAVRRKRLGHADASVTDGYTGTWHEDEKAAAEKIADLILGTLERLYPDCTLLRYRATSVQA